jgi:hypothetical protein
VQSPFQFLSIPLTLSFWMITGYQFTISRFIREDPATFMAFYRSLAALLASQVANHDAMVR